MDLLSAAALGLVQALTEFLPVSSSGHLVLGKAVLGINLEAGAAFEVAVHVGTLLSVVVLFWHELIELARAALRVLRAPWRVPALWEQDDALRRLVTVVIGCIPAGVVGLAFKDELEAAFQSTALVSGALLFTGGMLLATGWSPRGDQQVCPRRGAIIGLAQAFAIIPGISRSGSTIATAMFLRVEREAAVRFSFIMSVPVVAGAALLKARDLVASPPGIDLLEALGVGAAVSFVAGLGALWLLMRLVRRGRFAIFGWYCLAVGTGGLLAL